MELTGEYAKLAPIFDVFPKFGQEINYLLQRNNGHILDVAIAADDDSIFCGFIIRHDTGLIEINFFSITETLFVDFHDIGQLPTGYRLDFDENADIAVMTSLLESQLEQSQAKYDYWFSSGTCALDLRDAKEQLDGLRRRERSDGGCFVPNADPECLKPWAMSN